jgi:hypothetical protein
MVLVIVLLSLACAIDYFIDRQQETPWSVRVLLFLLQLAAIMALSFFWVIHPLLRRPSESELALWVESRMPDLRHRLVTAVQLNELGARTEGMSPELIAVVTREAQRQTSQAHFAGIADARRLGWALALAVPVALGAAIVALAVPVAPALLARQLLVDIPVPRDIYIKAVASERISPSGEPLVLEFLVSGKGAAAGLEGEVRIDPENLPSEEYPLVFSRLTAEGAIYHTEIPASSVDFSYSAFLGDGRKNPAGKVRYVPRPVVTDIQAWTLLPESCGLKPPTGSEEKISRRYDVAQPGADVIAIPSCDVKVQVTMQKPVSAAELRLLAAPRGPVIPLKLDSSGQVASGVFSLTGDIKVHGYEILVTDTHGFPNEPRPRRSIRIVPEEPPHVSLLPVSFPDPSLPVVLEDHIVQGMPIYPGLPIPIAYSCQGRYGLHHAQLLYRFPKKPDSGEGEPAKEEEWAVLDLPEVLQSEKTGPFLPRIGLFANSPPEAQVAFHAMPSPDPYARLGRIEGGGRFLFQTKKLFYRDKPVELKPDDQIEVCVEVFAGKPGDGRPSGRSEARVFSVMSRDDCLLWTFELINEQKRLEDLRQKQESMFRGK